MWRRHGSWITIQTINNSKFHWFNLHQGIVHFIAKVKQNFIVITPYLNAEFNGTEFVVSVSNESTSITVFEGKITANNSQGEVVITKNQSVIAQKNNPPIQDLNLKPRDAVHWSTHYPTIMTRYDYELNKLTENTQQSICR